MATITVTNLYDSGPGSLRQALLDATSGTTITFAPGLGGGTLTLTSGELDITQNVTINGELEGNGTPDITIDAGGASGVFVEGGSDLSVTLDGLVITGGSASLGGGIEVGTNDTLALKNSQVTGNHASVAGGGIYGGGGSDLALSNTTVSGNTSDGTGGGIYARTTLSTFNTTISGNYSKTEGGGIHLYTGALGSLTNTTVVGNKSGDLGGGIYGHAAQIRLYQSTLTGNDAGTVGGGIYLRGGGGSPSLQLSNSIVAGNAAPVSGPDLALDNSPLYLFGNSILGSTPINASLIDKTNGGYTYIDGTSQAMLETVFALVANNPDSGVLSGVPANNGGLVETVAINSTGGGIAYNTGSNAAVPIDLTQDGRGLPRVAGGTVDIGAFEQQPNAPLLVTTLADEPYDGGTLAQETADGTGLSLREALGLANAYGGTNTIAFTPSLAGGTIYLSNGELDITSNVTIDGDIGGNGTPAITIYAQGSRVFDIYGGSPVAATLDGLVMVNGDVVGENGGGIALGQYDTLTVSHSRLAGNSSASSAGSGGVGGAIYAGYKSNLTLVDTAIDHNQSDAGGGVALGKDGVLTLANTTINSNDSNDGGGIYFGTGAGGTLTNATIAGNRSSDNGGGIYGSPTADPIKLYNSTVTGNSAGVFGGGIEDFGFGTSSLTLANSIIAGNGANIGADIHGAAPLVLEGNNILGSAPANSISIDKTNGTYTQIDGTSYTALAGVFARVAPNPHTAVLSGVLAGNGGPVRTVAITAGGMAYNTGSNNALPHDALDLNDNSNTGEPLPVDARGFSRDVGGTVDIGAFEVQPGTVFEVTTLADNPYDGGTLAQELAEGHGLSLRQALGLANQDPTSDDFITFAPNLIGGSTHGVNDGTLLLTNGALTVNGNVTIEGDLHGDGSADITIDGQGNSQDFVITGGRVGLDGLTITGGNGYAYGGGVSLQTGAYAPADVVISHSTITNNQAAYGGGISVDPGDFLLLTNSTVSGNKALYVGGGIASQGVLEMLGTTVSGNSAGYIGGGIANDNILVLINSTLSNNQITNTSHSLRFGNGGGGLHNSGDAALVNTTVAGNTGGNAGGGIYNSGGLLLTNATIANNSAYNGGGLYSAACGCGNASIYDSTFTGNYANTLGGGIDNANGAVSLTNTIVAGNRGYHGADIANGVGITYYAGVNLFSQGGIGRPGTDIYQPDLTQVFGNLTTIDPDGIPNNGDEFPAGTLANNGGAVQTVAIAIGGNAQNTGSNGYLPTNVFNLDNSGNFGEPLPVDARGAPRVSGPAVDIGAVEAQPILALVPTNVGYTELSPPVELSPPFGNAGALTVTEAGASPTQLVIAGAAVTVTAGAVAGDMLAADTTGTNITASYDSATETLTLTGTDTLADYSQVLDSITFSSPSDNPDDFGSNPARVLTWSVTDIAGASSAPAQSTVNITPVNDPPTLSNVAATALVLYTGQTITLSPAATVSDPDSLTFASATVAITGGTFAGDGDVLAATTAGTSITTSYDSATETLTLSGTDTLAHYTQVLDSVTFNSTSPNPTNTNADATRTLTWTLDDGSASNNLSTAATSTISFRSWVKNDFNADRKSDLLLQNAPAAGTPDVMIDFLNGTSVASSATITTPTGWHVEAAVDFNHDGTSDLVLQNDDGQPEIWLMNGGTVMSTVVLPDPGASWHVIAATDFNGDGNADILWQNNDGQPAVWLMNGTTPFSGGPAPFNPGASWRAIGAGDFNGDGKADILWQNTDGQPVIWFMNGSSVIGGGPLPFNPGVSWKAIGVGDFNGDGKADILWQNTDGQPVIWFMNGTNVIGGGALPLNPGASWHAIGTSDFNGDGLADIVWQNTDGTPDIWEMNGTRILGGGPIANPGATWQVKADGPIPPDQMTSQLPAVHLSSPDTTSLISPLSTPDGVGSPGSGATQQSVARQLFAGAG